MGVPIRLDFDVAPNGNACDCNDDWKAHASMLYQGSDFSASFSVSVGGLAADFSGRTWDFRVFDKAKSAVILELDNAHVVGDSAGRVSISIPAALTKDLILGAPTRQLGGININDFIYSLDATDASGGVVRVAEGVFVISRDVK